MKKNIAFILLIALSIVLYVFWSSARLSEQTAVTSEPTLTQTDNTYDIERDLENVVITEDNEQYRAIQSDLESL